MEQKNLILGFDFGEKYSQFCCYDRGTHTAVSIPVKENHTSLCRRSVPCTRAMPHI